MGTWGFPLSRQDLSHVIKGYLDRLGRTTRFIDNLPGPDFMLGFMNRHPELSVRTANLIKRGWAALSHQDVNNFFDRVEKELEGVPSENIWNYDKMNLTDNPGAKKTIFKRGVKYAKQIRNHSQVGHLHGVLRNAAGDLVPPYIDFKAENLWKEWFLGGPKGSRYNTSPSGWFTRCFYSDWFHKSWLPTVQRQPGKHVLIGDNLSSHISVLWFLLDLMHSYNIAKYIYHIVRSFFVFFISVCTLLNVYRLIVCTLYGNLCYICASEMYI